MRNDFLADRYRLFLAAELAQDVGGVGIGRDEALIERARAPVGVECIAQPPFILEGIA